jgi:hypothetical protein
MRTRLPLAAALAGLLTLPSPAGAQDASAVFYERALLVEADRRCRLFEPGVSAALTAAAAQARGGRPALLQRPDGARRPGRALAKAAQTPCASPDSASRPAACASPMKAGAA